MTAAAHPGQPRPAVEEADLAAIRRLIQAWGFARDSGDWDSLAAFFHPEGRIAVSWFSGPYADFVETCRARPSVSFSKHAMAGTRIALNGPRAVAETDVLLFMRGTVEGVELVAETVMRFLDRIERREDGIWRVLERTALYDHDSMAPAIPGTPLPLRAEELAADAPGHRFIAWRLRKAGRTVPTDLPGRGSPAEAALRAGAASWLEAAA